MFAPLSLLVMCLGTFLWFEWPDRRDLVETAVALALACLALSSIWNALRRSWRLKHHRRAVALQILPGTLEECEVRQVGQRILVSGKLDGLPLTIEVGERWLQFDVPVKHARVPLDVQQSGLWRLLGLPPYFGRPQVTDPQQQVSVDHALGELMGPQGFSEVTLTGRRLSATVPLDGVASYVILSQARALARLCQACEAPPLAEVQLEPVGCDERCPYCHDALERDEELRRCPACRTPHHRACFREAGGCTLMGCERVARGPIRVAPAKAT